MSRARATFVGLASLLGLIVLAVGIPVALITANVPPVPTDLPSLMASDNAGAIIAALGCVAWVGWSVAAAMILIEVVAHLRGDETPQMAGMSLMQKAIRGLVGSVALMFVAMPAASAATVSAHQGVSVQAAASAPLPGVVMIGQQFDVTGPLPAASPTGMVHTVKPGETLWSLSELYLGDGAKFQQIAQVNVDALRGSGGWIEPGQRLVIPVSKHAGDATAARSAHGHYTVRKDDSLWSIAGRELGDSTRYPELYQATTGDLQPDGRTIQNPNLIYPGWQIELPGSVGSSAAPNANGGGSVNNESGTGAGRHAAPQTPQQRAPQSGNVPQVTPRPSSTPSSSTAPSASPSVSASQSSSPTPSASATPSGSTSSSDPGSSASPSASASGAPTAPSGDPTTSAPATTAPSTASTAPSRATTQLKNSSGIGSTITTASNLQWKLPDQLGGKPVKWKSIDIVALRLNDPDPVVRARGESELKKQTGGITLGGVSKASLVVLPVAADGSILAQSLVKVQEMSGPIRVQDAQDRLQRFAASDAEFKQVNPKIEATKNGYGDPVAFINLPGGTSGQLTYVNHDGVSTEIQVSTPVYAQTEAVASTMASTLQVFGSVPLDSGRVSQAAPAAAPASTSTVPTSAPAVSQSAAPVMEQSHQVQDAGDGLMTELRDPIRMVGVGALLATGILAFVGARRVVQQRRRRPGTRIAMPTGPVARTEQELRAVADPISVEAVDIALRVLAAECAAQGAPLPVVRAAQLTSQEFVLYLAEPLELPDPWMGSANGTVWALTRPLQGINMAAIAGVPAPYPSLVTVGHDMEEAHVMLDLEHLGTLNVVGDSVVSSEVMTAVAIELATSVWADDLQVTVVGMCHDLEDALQTGRIRYVPSVDAALEGLERRAEKDRDVIRQSGSASLHHARAGGTASATWSPEIVLVAEELTLAQQQRLDLVINALPRVAVAAVTTSAQAPVDNDGSWRIEVSPGSDVAVLQPLDLEFRPQRVTAQTYEHIVAMVTTTEEDPVSGSAESVSTSVPQGWSTGDTGMLPPVLDVPSNADDDATGGAPWSFSEPTYAAYEPSAYESPTDEPLSYQHPPVSDPMVTSPTAESSWNVHPLPAPRDETAPRVMVLGPVTVERVSGRVEPGKLARLTEFAAYLALHPHANEVEIDDAIWPYRQQADNSRVRHAATSKLRAWLGTNDQGVDYVLRYPEGGRVLAESVGTDWAVWQRLVPGEADAASTEHLAEALTLVRGRPFEGTHPRHYAWAENLRQEMISGVVDVSYELARRRVMAGRWRAAEEAIVVGLTIEPGMERLWRLRIVAAKESGNQAAVAEAVNRMLAITDALGGDLEPETLDLLSSLESPGAIVPGAIGQ